MLVELFPGAHARYASLPVLGRHLEGFIAWLRAEGHSQLAMRRRIRAACRLDELLGRHNVSDVGTLTASDLLAYVPIGSQNDVSLAAVIRSFVQYLGRQGMLAAAPPTAVQSLLDHYGVWLQRDRGLAAHTVQHHAGTIRELLDSVGYDRDPNRLHTLQRDDLEHFIQRLAARRSRASLQHVAAHLRVSALAGQPRRLLRRTRRAGRHTPRLPWRAVASR